MPVVVVIAACHNDVGSVASATTDVGTDTGTPSSSEGADTSTSGEVEDAPAPVSCGEVLVDSCTFVGELAIAPDGDLVIAGSLLGPQVEIVDADGVVQWQYESSGGNRGSYSDLAMLPDGGFAVVGNVGTISNGELSATAIAFDAQAEGLWAFDGDTGSDFPHATWWPAQERLVVVARAPGMAEQLWFFDAEGALRRSIDVAVQATDALVVLGDGFVTCGSDTLVHYGPDLMPRAQLEVPAPRCGALASDGERLALMTYDDELLVIDGELEITSRTAVATSDSVAFHGDNIVLTQVVVDTPSVAMHWLTAQGEPLWTMEHPWPTGRITGAIAADDDRLWVAANEIEGSETQCYPLRLACYEYGE